ncbi:MAG: hypothetical protein M0R21_12875 [Lentimicrobiaceae bacterium]|jgi:hypothetical protein|nr:hypothetical protein [Lentimicrobiaceae bacterium]
MKEDLYLLFLSFFLLLLVNDAFSQKSNWHNTNAISTFNMFREPSYISALGGIGNIEPLIFEGDIAPYYILSLNPENRWGIELSPRIIIRMYNKHSYPVRTPSYMPRATFFYQIIDNTGQKKDWFTYFSWCHHSNGQDGSFYYEADSTKINTYSGNFSTNLFEGGIFMSRPEKKKPYVINYLKLSASYHYKQNPEIRKLYGRLRFFADYQSSVDLSKILKKFSNPSVKYHKGNINQMIRLGWIAGSMPDANDFDFKRRLVFRYTLSYKPSFFNDVTIFAQYYYGQDYYNIYFNRTLSLFRVGIAAKTSIFN